MKQGIWKIGFWIVMGVFIFVNVFLINIVLHEAGHYIAADYYDLDPKINYELENMTEVGFSFESVPVASTSFVDSGDPDEIRVIAMMGSFVNLVLGLIFMVFFAFSKNFFVKEMLLICIVVSLGSGIMNLIPFGGSDGALIFGLV